VLSVCDVYGQHTASTSSSDSPMKASSVSLMARSRSQKLQVKTLRRLPEPHEFGQLDGDLHLYFDDVNAMPPAERIEIARRTEAAAMAYDTRIQNSRGGDFDHRHLAQDHDELARLPRRVQAQLLRFSVSPIAQDEKGGMQRKLLVFECAHGDET